jgi:hypothetical protein
MNAGMLVRDQRPFALSLSKGGRPLWLVRLTPNGLAFGISR